MKRYENFIKDYCDVSRETFSKLEWLDITLKEWQGKFNLVSNSSVEDAWNRHFLDSAQVFKFVPESAQTLVDFGSGAGFPALVLAILAQEKTPYLKVTMLESVAKKTMYLNHVCESLSLNTSVLNQRIEKTKLKNIDVITARALTSLKDLCAYALPFCGKNTVCIFLKGEKYAQEVAEAQTKYCFDVEVKNSQTSDLGKILILKNLKEIK